MCSRLFDNCNYYQLPILVDLDTQLIKRASKNKKVCGFHFTILPTRKEEGNITLLDYLHRNFFIQYENPDNYFKKTMNNLKERESFIVINHFFDEKFQKLFLI